MRTTPEECARIGRVLAEKCNLSTGPVSVLIPLGGISVISAPGQPFHWPEADAALFGEWKRNLRPGIPVIEHEGNIREEVHLGAALWNRGSVLLGIYGQWHGNPVGDRRYTSIDLGLTVTHDAIHHREPIPGYKLIPAREQPGSPAADMPALMQGQGFENVGDKTYYWYSLWKGNEGTGVRLVTWDRDRLGMLKPIYPSGVSGNPTAANYGQAVSCAVKVSAGGKAKMFVNASGLGAHSRLRIALLDAAFQPIPGYHAIIAADGLRSPVNWENRELFGASLGECYVQVGFEGVRPEDANFHALYLEPVAP